MCFSIGNIKILSISTIRISGNRQTNEPKRHLQKSNLT